MHTTHTTQHTAQESIKKRGQIAGHCVMHATDVKKANVFEKVDAIILVDVHVKQEGCDLVHAEDEVLLGEPFVKLWHDVAVQASSHHLVKRCMQRVFTGSHRERERERCAHTQDSTHSLAHSVTPSLTPSHIPSHIPSREHA